jgi:hypothetical protein
MSWLPSPLRLERNKLNAAIAMFTEPYLEQAHYLLAANHSPGCGSASKGFLERLSTRPRPTASPVNRRVVGSEFGADPPKGSIFGGAR